MGDDAARGAGEALGEQRGDDGGRGRRQDGARLRVPVEFAEDRALEVHDLGAVLLHEIGARDGRRQAVAYRDPGESGIDIAEKIPGMEVFHAGPQEARRRAPRLRHGIPDPDVPAGAREDDRPRPSNQPGSDDRDLWHPSTLRVPTLARRSCHKDRQAASSPKKL